MLAHKNIARRQIEYGSKERKIFHARLLPAAGKQKKQGWAHQGRNTRSQPTNQKLQVFVRTGERERERARRESLFSLRKELYKSEGLVRRCRSFEI